jgi:hypothetical protein
MIDSIDGRRDTGGDRNDFISQSFRATDNKHPWPWPGIDGLARQEWPSDMIL